VSSGRREVRHPLFARFYRRLSASLEDRGLGEARQRLLAGLAGTVVEVGGGDGANLRHLPAGVDRVVLVEPEPWLRARAREEAARLAARPGAPAYDVVDGLADALPLGDGEADAVVVSLVLCSVPDPVAAVAEARRVLRPGGELRFLEHVRGGPVQARAQALLDRTVWPRLFGGCHCGRDALAALAAGGLPATDVEHRRFPRGRAGRLVPVAPHVAGRSVKPVARG